MYKSKVLRIVGRSVKKLTSILLLWSISTVAIIAQVANIFPANTATHTAVQSGAWFDPSTWDTGTIPSDAAIVLIPVGLHVEYAGCTDAHIFAIRVNGQFTCEPEPTSGRSCLRFDTFIAGHMSLVKIHAINPDEQIDITIDPFDIEAHKAGDSGYDQPWNEEAMQHYSDGAPVFTVIREVRGDRRYNTIEEALSGDTRVVELSRKAYDDGPGVTGRYLWDSQQHSLGLITMGQIEIIGAPKTAKVKLSRDATINEKKIDLTNAPEGWKVDDQIVISRDGFFDNGTQAEDYVSISSIDENTISLQDRLRYNHQGVEQDSLHCFAGNLNRNITIRSAKKDQLHQRGHVMAMHQNDNLQIRNSAFVDLGRTDKSRVIDDYIWDKWLTPRVFKSKISPLGQEICQMKSLPVEDVTNIRGRYSIHLHKTGAKHTDNIVHVTGNVVIGNPGWGITHHDSYADVSHNLVVDVVGAGIVSESGSELGFWDDNFVIDIKQGHKMSPYDAAVFHDDLLFSGQGLGMKGRGVICRNNVIVATEQGVGVLNLNPSVTNHDRVDPLALAKVRPGFEFDQFPLSHNGFSAEGDGIMPVEVPLKMENTFIIDAQRGLRSIERDMGLNHESRSIFDGYTVWGTKHGLSINYQADYSFKDIYISGNGKDNTIGMFMWKHSHNQSFENIKLVDLEYGVQVSQLVESSNGNLKTRNNGFTPWLFVNLAMDNVDQLYLIQKEDQNTTTIYTEHSDNTIILDSEDITSRPTTFTLTDRSTQEVDYQSGDFRFEVDGLITDDFGTYHMGTEQALAQGDLRLDYPSRIYEFASEEKFEEFLLQQGVYQDLETNEFFFIIDEWLPNRRTFKYDKFSIPIIIKNPPSKSLFTEALVANYSDFDSQSQLLSQFATATQSSTAQNVSYQSTSINPSADKAIDGNNNGRINCQIHQRDLLPVGSFSQTEVESEAWFDLDLKKNSLIEYIDIWNTVELNQSNEAPPSQHMIGLYLLISDSPFNSMGLQEARNHATFEYYIDEVKRKYSLNELNIKGRYVRLQTEGVNKIQIAEIDIIGKSGDAVNTTIVEPRSDLSLYPNPNHGRFVINAHNDIIHQVTVHDLQGKLMYQKDNIKSNIHLITIQLPVGPYLVKAYMEGGYVECRKMIVIE